MKEEAVFGGGCFWCIEAIFQELIGVEEVISGYAGGTITNPTYEQVCTGETGHAEVIKIIFNPEEITYKELLEMFFKNHDPTALNRQGGDIGTQYRSVIFYYNIEQKEIAEFVIDNITKQGIWKEKIVTELSPLKDFYKAEEYHQNYFLKNPTQGYCKVIIEPKVSKFRKKNSDKIEECEIETITTN